MKLLRAVGHYAGYPVGLITLSSLWVFTQATSLFWKLRDRQRNAVQPEPFAGGNK